MPAPSASPAVAKFCTLMMRREPLLWRFTCSIASLRARSDAKEPSKGTSILWRQHPMSVRAAISDALARQTMIHVT